MVLPDEYANFRKALVKAGFIFSEERDCVAKGFVHSWGRMRCAWLTRVVCRMGFSMAFRSGRSQDKLDVQLSSLTIVGTIRPERHRCDYPSVYDKVEQSGSRDAATKKCAFVN